MLQSSKSFHIFTTRGAFPTKITYDIIIIEIKTMWILSQNVTNFHKLSQIVTKLVFSNDFKHDTIIMSFERSLFYYSKMHSLKKFKKVAINYPKCIAVVDFTTFFNHDIIIMGFERSL